MLSGRWWKYFQGSPIGVTLTVTMEGTGSATALMTPYGLIIVDADTAEASKYINLSTPLSFKVIDVHTIHGDTTACTVTISNAGSAISDAISLAASDTDIDRAAEIDDAYDDFTYDDNDLRIDVGTDILIGRVIIHIQYT